jgi:CO/xanthine dehydrogenase Mo-binding subunit
VFRATGPTSGASMTVKIGVKRDGTMVAADGLFKLQAGAFPGSPFMSTCMCAFAPYDIPNARAIGYDVVSNRPKVAAYRAPGSPLGAFAVESVLDVLAQKIGMDPLKLRLKNAAKKGTQMLSGGKLGHDGYADTIKALLNHPGYTAPLGKNQARGVASGYWFNGGGESSATVHVNEDGTVVVATGSPDIGGSRASMAIMAAETLGIDYDQVRPIIADTASVGYTHVTGGSRVTFATGMAVVDTTKKIIQELCVRAAKMWNVDPEGVVWEDGHAKPASSNVGTFKPLSLKEIAAKRAQTGGPIVAAASVNPAVVAPGFATQFCDLEVDPETGKVTILRFVAAQDVGRAIHPSYVEGQIQGGVTQGIGWALNEEYVYNSRGLMENAGFLDYRIPVSSDLPMIEPIMVEVPNPNHAYGAKGAAEVNICPPMAAIANAIERAVGARLTELPMSPPKVRAAIDARGQK